jgi:hypothetical protein
MLSSYFKVLLKHNLFQRMATTEMIVAITLIVIGVFYILERLLNVIAILFAWYYGGDTVERNDNVDAPEPGEEIQGLN